MSMPPEPAVDPNELYQRAGGRPVGLDPATTGVDVGTPTLLDVDERLRRLRNVEASWGAPSLPDEVKLDLVSSGYFGSADELEEFLWGIEKDRKDAIRNAKPVQPFIAEADMDLPGAFQLGRRQTARMAGDLTDAKATEYGPMFAPKDSWVTDLRRIVSGVAGVDQPEVASNEAVQAWQRQAVKHGLLKPDEIDGVWRPEKYGRLRPMVAESVMWDRLSGNRPGAVSARSVVDVFDKWLSPSGLIAAGMALDFIPDPKAIGREFSGWGDKWRRWWKNKTSPRDFIDAVTGPIDDIVFPVVNTALLIAGVGQVYNFARVGGTFGRLGLQYGDDVVRGASLVKSLFSPTVDVAAEVANLSRPSMLALRLGKSSNFAAHAAGDAMKAWRQFKTVQVVKKAVQRGMILGFAGQLENLLLPNREGGYGLPDLVKPMKWEQPVDETGKPSGPLRQSTEPAVTQVEVMDAFRDYRSQHMGAYALAELLFQPTTLFQPGTFSRWWSAPKDLLLSEAGVLLDDLPKRSSAVQGLQRALADRHVTVEFLEGSLDVLRRRAVKDPALKPRLDQLTRLASSDPEVAVVSIFSGVDPEELVQLKGRALEAIRSKVPGVAAHRRLSKWDQAWETAAEKIQWFSVMAGKEAKARSILNWAALDEDDAFWVRQLLERNAVSTLRPIRVGDLPLSMKEPGAEQAVAAALWERAISDTTDALLHGKITPRRIKGEEQRLFNSLLARLRAGDDDMLAELRDAVAVHEANRQAQLHDMMDALAREPGMIASYLADDDLWDTLDHWDDYLDALKIVDEIDEPLDLPRAAHLPDLLQNGFLSDMSDELHKAWLTSEQSRRSAMTQMRRADLLRGRLTVAKQDTPTRQVVEQLESIARNVRAAKKALSGVGDPDRLWATYGPLAEQYASEIGTTLQEMSKAQAKGFARWLKVNGHPSEQGLDRWLDAMSFTVRTAGSPADPVTHAKAMERALLRSPALQKLGISRNVTIDELVDRLHQIAPRYAIEVEAPADIAGHLATLGPGYKLVYGQGFLHPSEVLDLDGPLSHIRTRHLEQVSLGTFLSPHPGSTIDRMRRQRFWNVADKHYEGLDFFSVEDDLPQLHIALDKKASELTDAVVMGEQAAQEGGRIERVLRRAANSFTPQYIWSLRPSHVRQVITQTFPHLDERQVNRLAQRVVAHLADSQLTSVKYLGLAELENWVVAHNIPLAGLRVFRDSMLARPQSEKGIVWRSLFGTAVDDAPVQMETFRKAKRAAAAAAGALIGVGVAANEDDVNPLAAAGVGATSGALFPSLVSGKTVARAGLGVAAGNVAGFAAREAGGDEDQVKLATVLGGVAGAAFAPGILRGVEVGGGKILAGLGRVGIGNGEWAEYSKLGRTYTYLRDRLRFSLNPFFDLQNMTETASLSLTAELPDGVMLPVRTNLLKAYMQQADESYDELVKRFRLASGGAIHPEIVESTVRKFTDRGIFGYSVTDNMIGAFGFLTKQGIDPIEAAKFVQNKFTYGVKGRSGLELSANFVFFPLSFVKHYLTEVGRFLSTDLGRAIVIHDALRLYDYLDQNYDLGEKLSDHLPILNQLRKFNSLAMGISPGEFGGINRPLFNLAKPFTIDPILNMFIPQAVPLWTEEDANNLEKTLLRLSPAVRDINYLWKDVQEQANIFSTGLGATAEEERGIDEEMKLRRIVEAKARQWGLTMSQVMSPGGPGDSLRQWFVMAKQDLLRRYPRYAAGKIDRQQYAVQAQMDLKEMILDPDTPAEQGIAIFETQYVDPWRKSMQKRGLDDYEDIDLVPDEVARLRDTARGLLAMYGHEFAREYRRYYGRQFGPILEAV